MSNALAPEPAHNQLLARLPKSELKRISQGLEPVFLPAKKILYEPHAPIGIASAIILMSNGSAIEVATIGNEGVTGLIALFGNERSRHKVIVQVPGHGFRMSAQLFQEEAARGGPLRKILVRYQAAFSLQVSYLVACNGLHKVEKRCCRWLLSTQDRVGTSSLPLTHEFLAIMLGVRRATVSEVLRPLQQRRLIHSARGMIEILDRSGLEAFACECYRAVEQEFARSFD
jgi:CRP-like cAMP-binding protein